MHRADSARDTRRRVAMAQIFAFNFKCVVAMNYGRMIIYSRDRTKRRQPAGYNSRRVTNPTTRAIIYLGWSGAPS
jgi:hypothetical protein